MTTEQVVPVAAAAPVKAMWICMILAWVFFILPVPFTIFIASPLNLAALILAIICLVRGRVAHGVLGLFGTTVASGIMYLIGISLMVAATAAASTIPVQ